MHGLLGKSHADLGDLQRINHYPSAYGIRVGVEVHALAFTHPLDTGARQGASKYAKLLRALVLLNVAEAAFCIVEFHFSRNQSLDL